MKKVLEGEDVVATEPPEGRRRREEEPSAGRYRAVLVAYVADLLQRPSTLGEAGAEFC